MAEEIANQAADTMRDELEIAKVKAHTTWKKLAKEFDTTEPQISRAIKGDMSPKSKVIREWLYSRLNIK